MIGPAEDVVPQGFLLEESCMTREEQKKEKLKKEKEFIESIKGKALNQQEKSKFRETTVWKDFRNPFKGQVDPITLRKLPKRFALHHLCLNPAEYMVLIKSRFRPHNSKMHDVVHYLYGYYRKDKDILKRLKKELDIMVELNDGRDICDYKKELKKK